MSAFKGTPGPLGAIGHKVHGNGIHIASAWYPGEMPVVQDERLGGESWIDCYTRLKPTREAIKAKMTANARLISAAQDLLDALDQVLSAALSYQLREEDAAVVYARATIAKALGGES